MNTRESREFQIKMERFITEYEETRHLFMDALRADFGILKDRVDKLEERKKPGRKPKNG